MSSFCLELRSRLGESRSSCYFAAELRIRGMPPEPPRECSTANVNTVCDLHEFPICLSKSDVLIFHFSLIQHHFYWLP
jgi:hypothetical protein